MKKLMMAMVSALILTACEQAETTESAEMGEVQLTINQWDLACDDMPTRAVTAAEAQMTDIWLLAYKDGSLVEQVHQASTDDGFGSISLRLSAGSYSFYVVSARGSSPVIDTTAKTITWGTVRDTFWSAEDMEVSAGTNTKSITLSRVASRLRLALTDVIPTGAGQIIVKPSHWYYGLNYQTGAAVGDSNADISLTIPSTYIGRSDLSSAFMTISPAGDWTTDVTATMRGAGDSTLGSVLVSAIPMGRNKSTTINGSILTGSAGFGLTVNDAWLDPVEITF